MKFGFLSDAHGNFAAFHNTVKFLRKQSVNKIYFLGDALGYFPSVEVLDFLIENKKEIISIAGNHDLMYVQHPKLSTETKSIYCFDHIMALLTAKHKCYLNRLPVKVEFELFEKKITLVHGGPSNYTNQYVFEDTDVDIPGDFLILGHTHRAFIRNAEQNKIILNVGSCGLPRDDGRFSTCATLDMTKGEVVIHRIEIHKYHLETLERFTPFVNKNVNQLFERRSFSNSATHKIRKHFL